MNQDSTKIRNVAIIAHVDHGKTTLVDGLLKQSNIFRDNQAEMQQKLIMDSGDQERERGITITAKITAVNYQDYRINIIDTPGHADFSGEVERILNMADGCLLVVDAQEGPMPQTKFVLKKALASGLKPIVVINKIDKPGHRLGAVEDEIADLFLELAIHEDQLHYPVYYAIGREAKAWKSVPADFTADADLRDIFEAIVAEVPSPNVEIDGPFQLLVTALDWDSYKGKYAIGRIARGNIKTSSASVLISSKDNKVERIKVDKIFINQGLSRVEVGEAIAGDIVSLTGIANAQIGDTIADAENPEALPPIELEAPTLKIYLGPNTSPFKGQEGDFTTSRQIGDRLHKELETNIGLKVEDDGIGFLVSGRGELHLSVLIETMRREGYEFEIGRPMVVTRLNGNVEEEPIEELNIEVPDEHVGAVTMEIGRRKANLIEQFSGGHGVTKLVYEIPTRAMIGLRGLLLTATKGTIIMNSLMLGYKPKVGAIEQNRNGALVAFETGTATTFALQTSQDRGISFIEAGTKVYAGQIVGLNSRSGDLEINVVKEKHLTNMRSKGSDKEAVLTPATIFSLEQSMDFLEEDELLEITPKSLRLRKKELDHGRRRSSKK